MITKFDNFIKENVGTPLNRYLLKNTLRHEHLIGKRVMTSDGDVWYINTREIKAVEGEK